jgi:tetratricopeptide (TPR) repeat protein
VCQAHAGRYADAERTLVRAGANAQAYKSELMMRLGETRIALGKLDEAIDALEAALEANDSLNDMARWLLAVAYDRARRPGDAQQYALDAKRYDQALTLISSPRMPLLGSGDTEYLYGIAYLYALPRPEYALLYFRRFLHVAPDSPWKRRAEEHVRELTAMKFPARDTITASGSAPVNIDTMRTALEKPMPKLRACAAKLPGSAFQLTITKVGPRTPETARDRPIYRMPPPDVRGANVLNVDNNITQAEVSAAITCLEKLAPTLAIPSPKERDTFYRLSFVVVAP